MLTRYLPNLLPKNNSFFSTENAQSSGNMDSPEFDTARRPNKRIIIDLASVLHPTALKLRVKWEPNPFNALVKAIKATYIHQNHPFTTINYVSGNTQTCESINLIYDNRGEITFVNTVKTFQGFECNDWILNNCQALLYTKLFAVPQHQNLTVQLLTREQTKSFYATPRYPQGMGEAQPIFCYGAYFHPNINIEDIVPYYSVIRFTRDKSTALEFKTQTEWHSEGIYENNYDYPAYYFHDVISPNEILTLANAIRGGLCQVPLSIDGETITFKSFKFDEVSPENQSFTIYFNP